MFAKSALIIIGAFLTFSLKEINCILPSSITPCSRNLPEPEKCLLEEVEKLRTPLAVGDLGDGFKTIPLEPLYLEKIHFRQGPDFTATFSNLWVNGPSKFVVKKLKADIPNMNFNFTLLLPKLNFTGKYALKMKLLVLDIHGHGPFNGTLYDSIANVRIIGRTEEREGVKYVKFDSIGLKVNVGRARYNMENLFNGDPTLGALGNQFVNENAKLFADEMIPFIEKSLAKTFLEIVNVVMKDVTFDEMFPDKPVPNE